MSQLNVGTTNSGIVKLGSYNGIDNFPVGLSASDAGSIIYDSDKNALAYWNGSNWKLLSGSGTADGSSASNAFAIKRF